MGYGIKPLFEVEDKAGLALQGMNGATGAYGRVQPGQTTETKAPGKTAGGAIQGILGGGAAGAGVGAMMASEAASAAGGLAAIGGPVPLLVGAGLGLGAYLFS